VRLGQTDFRPTLALTLATLLAVAGFVRLGIWQLDRAEEKTRFGDTIAERLALPPLDLSQNLPPVEDLRYRRAHVRGTYMEKTQVLLDNQILQGRPGYHVLTPLRTTDSQRLIVVNRGWVPLGPDRATRPQAVPPNGVIEVHGRLDTLPVKPFGLTPLTSADWGWRWLYFDRDQFQRQFGMRPEPYILLEDPDDADDALPVRAWPLPATGGHRHIAYAIQWFAFAIIATVVYLRLSLYRVTAEHL
jgi:surfeit locus 1 family protein